MLSARKLILLLTLLCYLAASSVAAAHGFSNPSQDLKQNPEQNSMSSPVLPISAVSEFNDMGCHSSQTSSDEKSSSTACQIFCSVMAHAVTGTASSISFDTTPLAGVTPFRVSALSRQLAVETHPPK